MTRLCRARGIDPAAEPIPVAPGAHYACGGIRAGLDGRTSLPGLYAVGEVASTGVHGANRLASNSLTEALITGRRAGELLGRELPEPPARLRLPPAGPGANPAARPPWPRRCPGTPGWPVIAAAWNASGSCWPRPGPPPGGWTWPRVEATNLHVVSVLVTAAALARTESRGCHRWRDAPPATPAAGPGTRWCAPGPASAGRPGRCRTRVGAGG